MNLKEALEKGCLEEFIKERENDYIGDAGFFVDTVISMSGEPIKRPKEKPPR